MSFFSDITSSLSVADIRNAWKICGRNLTYTIVTYYRNQNTVKDPDRTDTQLIRMYLLVLVGILLISAQKALNTTDADSTDFCLVRISFPDSDLQTTTDCHCHCGHERSSAYPQQTVSTVLIVSVIKCQAGRPSDVAEWVFTSHCL